MTEAMTDPLRGEIWIADLSPGRGHEQKGIRPCLIVSDDLFNRSPAGLVVVLPITSRNKGIRSHVRLVPPEGGVAQVSFIKCEDVRCVSTQRLANRLGKVKEATMKAVAQRLSFILAL